MPGTYEMIDTLGPSKEIRIDYSREVVPDPDPYDMGDMEGERPDYVFGVRAKAVAYIPTGSYPPSCHMMTLRSAGLWGVGVDDPDDPHLEEVYQEELTQLKRELSLLGTALVKIREA
jgi:hypothetical protein